jgi:hypothetical protein
MLTSLFYGFWDYWNLYHKVTFDGINKLILINEGVTDLDVQADIYSNWKEWVQLEENLKYTTPFKIVGGEPTVAGQRLDVTYFLINGWKIKPFPGSYTLNLVGNIFDVDGGDIKVPADVVQGRANNITINLNTSVIVRQVDTGTGTGGLTPDEHNTLYNIEGIVISIQNTQNTQLSSIEAKLNEIWQLHGLDVNNPLRVTQTERTFGTVAQTIVTTGENQTQETIIIRQ